MKGDDGGKDACVYFGLWMHVKGVFCYLRKIL